jgi:uncharacterized hydrophobic protein (TIGR00271 family)
LKPAADAADGKLEVLRREFEHQAAFTQVFVVLTVGATLIATLGLLANSASVVIGAMVVAPWILPLQAMAFEILQGRLPMFLRALRTLLLGVGLCVALSAGVGLLVAYPSFGSEVINRTSPNLLDLGVALVAGAVAMYAKLRKEAISALAGLAIAVALVPPMCVVGLLLAAAQWQQAYGAMLLFATNLLGIMVGAMAALGILEGGGLPLPAASQPAGPHQLGAHCPTGNPFGQQLLPPTGALPQGGGGPAAGEPDRAKTTRQHDHARQRSGHRSDRHFHRLAQESTADPGTGARHRCEPAHPLAGGGGAGVQSIAARRRGASGWWCNAPRWI